MANDFQEMVSVLQEFQLQYEVNWSPSKEKWQGMITDLGISVSANACVSIKMQDTESLYSSGKTFFSYEGQPFGPSGMLLLSVDTRTGLVINNPKVLQLKEVMESLTETEIREFNDSLIYKQFPLLTK